MSLHYQWKPSTTDPSITFREDEFSLQFSNKDNDLVFLCFQKEQWNGDICVSALAFPPSKQGMMVRALKVASVEFGISFAQRSVRLTSIAPFCATKAEIAEAYEAQRVRLKQLISLMGHQPSTCNLDQGRGGKIDLRMDVL